METHEQIDALGLGRLERLDPRNVWRNEATDLTPWLLENLDVLAEALGTEIIPTQREVRVGDFKLDILGEDPSGRPIIIENQLEATDHSHLGQLIVYASGLEAAVVVWVTPRFRDEHRRALDWLNERTDENVYFFGVELDLVRIGSSAPAPSFRLLSQPNDWQKAVKRARPVCQTKPAPAMISSRRRSTRSRPSSQDSTRRRWDTTAGSAWRRAPSVTTRSPSPVARRRSMARGARSTTGGGPAS